MGCQQDPLDLAALSHTAIRVPSCHQFTKPRLQSPLSPEAASLIRCQPNCCSLVVGENYTSNGMPEARTESRAFAGIACATGALPSPTQEFEACAHSNIRIENTCRKSSGKASFSLSAAASNIGINCKAFAGIAGATDALPSRSPGSKNSSMCTQECACRKYMQEVYWESVILPIDRMI